MSFFKDFKEDEELMALRWNSIFQQLWDDLNKIQKTENNMTKILEIYEKISSIIKDFKSNALRISEIISTLFNSEKKNLYQLIFLLN